MLSQWRETFPITPLWKPLSDAASMSLVRLTCWSTTLVLSSLLRVWRIPIPAEWTKAIDINVKGVYYGIRACLPTMLEAGGGTIVNVSSGAATSAMEGWSHYCSSKAAVLSVTQCVHKEYGEQGIRMLGMSPGTVATGMQVAIKASGLNPVSQLDPSVHIPAEWAAKAIVWLCTPESDEFKGTDFSLRAPGSYERVGIA